MLFLLASAFTLAATQAQAAVPSPAVTPQAAPVVLPKEKKICRSEVGTGSIMPKKICHTQAEWDSMGAENARTLGQMDNQQRIGQTTHGTR